MYDRRVGRQDARVEGAMMTFKANYYSTRTALRYHLWRMAVETDPSFKEMHYWMALALQERQRRLEERRGACTIQSHS